MKHRADMPLLSIVTLLSASMWAGSTSYTLPGEVSPQATDGALRSTGGDRTISVDYRSDEILLSILPARRILALSLDADNPEMSNTVSSAVRIPLRLDLNVERLLSLEPDAVIVGRVGLDDPINLLEIAGVKIVRLNPGNTLSEIQQNILMVANGVGEGDSGAQLLARMNARLALIRKLTKGLARPRTLYVYVGGASTETAGGNTYIDELLDIAGALNIAREAGIEGWGSLPVEKAIEMNPEVVIYADSSGRDKTRNMVAVPDLENSPVWRDIEAVKAGRVYQIPGRYLFCGTHFCAETAEAMAVAIHPEIRASLQDASKP